MTTDKTESLVETPTCKTCQNPRDSEHTDSHRGKRPSFSKYLLIAAAIFFLCVLMLLIVFLIANGPKFIYFVFISSGADALSLGILIFGCCILFWIKARNDARKRVCSECGSPTSR